MSYSYAHPTGVAYYALVPPDRIGIRAVNGAKEALV